MLLSELHIGAFRGVRALRLTGLGSVNLLVGANNSGKTSVLEAASLLVRPLDPLQWLRLLQCRDIDQKKLSPEKVWGMFPGAGSISSLDVSQQSETMVIEGRVSEGLRRFEAIATARQTGELLADQTPELSVSADLALTPEDRADSVRCEMKLVSGHGPEMGSAKDQASMRHRAVPLAPSTRNSTARLIDLFSHAVSEGEKALALELLRLIDARIEDIDMVQSHGEKRLVLKHAVRGAVDLAAFGDGMRQALALALAVTRARGGLLLIDEFEAGIHHRLLVEVMRHLLQACRHSRAQIFCSSHSLEAIDALLDAAEELGMLSCLTGFWLKSEPGGHGVRRYEGERLLDLREGGLDIR